MSCWGSARRRTRRRSSRPTVGWRWNAIPIARRLHGPGSAFKAISEAYDCLKDPQKRAAYDRFGQAAFQNGGGGRTRSAAAGLRRLSESSRPSSASSWTRRPAPDAARGADLRYDLEMTPRRSVRRRREDDRGRGAGPCETATAAAAQGRPARDLPQLRRHGQGPRAAGLLRGRARLPDLPRLRRGDRRSVPRTATAKAARSTSASSTVKIPAGVDEGTRIRVSGEGEAGVRGAAAATFICSST